MVNPAVKRLRGLALETGMFVSTHGSEQQRRMQRILNIIIDEAMEELAQMPERELALWLSNMARVIQWTASGNIEILPDELIPLACKLDGITEAEYYASIYVDTAEPDAEPDDDDVVEGVIVDEPLEIEA